MFFWSGSRPEQLKEWAADVINPLPACPSSPNCVRLAVEVPVAVREVYHASLDILQDMNTFNIISDSEFYTIEAVFRIALFHFRDQFDLQMEEVEHAVTLVYIRSSSRVGYSDLGVNRRRVRRFLTKLYQQLDLGENIPRGQIH